jgi:hypothetical protein
MSDTDIEYDDDQFNSDDDKIEDNEEDHENETKSPGTLLVKKKHGGTIDDKTVSANPLDADLLPASDSEQTEVRKAEAESKLLRNVEDEAAKQQIKAKLAAAQSTFGKLSNPPKEAANDNFRPIVSWPLMDQLTRKTFEPDRERRAKNVISARYLREMLDTIGADSLGQSVHLPGKSASGDHDMQRTESGRVFFEQGQTLDRKKGTHDTKNGENEAQRFDGPLRRAKKSLPVGNSGFDLPFPLRKLAACEELDAVIAAVGPMLWPYLRAAISENATMTDIGLALGVKRFQAPREGTAIIRRGLTAAMEALAKINAPKDEPQRKPPVPEKSRGHFLNQTRNYVVKNAA